MCPKHYLRIVLLLIPGLLASTVVAQPRFTDVTQEVIPLPVFGAIGMSFSDYNNDGWPDLFLAEGNSRIDDGGDRVALLHNDGRGRLNHRPGALPTDLLPFNPRFINGQTLGPGAFGDYDKDGDLDLYLPLGAYWLHRRNQNILLRNDGGVFTDVSREAGLAEELSSATALWLDYDRDGYLDLYVTDDAGVRVDILLGRGEHRGPPTPNRLYRNNQDGTFTDITVTAGLGLIEEPGAIDVAAPDLDDDGWPDLYVGISDSPNRLFLNDAQGGFQDATPGDLADPGEANGIAIGDIDNDGRLDLFQTSASGVVPNTPFRSLMLLNLGDGQFLDVTEGVGLGALTNISVRNVGLADLDNDGDLDIVTGQPAFLFLNDGSLFFTDATAGANLPPDFTNNGLLIGDYDRDGCLDLVYGSQSIAGNDFGGVYRNSCNDHHYLRIELIGRASNRHGIGARIRARSGDLQQTRQLLGGTGSYQTEAVAHFGLGDRTRVDTLEVRWPSGQIDVHTDLPADRQLRLFEGATSYHTVEPTRWTHALPDSIKIGATLDWDIRVEPALFAPDGRIERVTADLSAWGGDKAEPLVPEDEGIYRLNPGSRLVEGLAGVREITVRIEQMSTAGPTWTLLAHPVYVIPRDLPIAPLSVYGDELAPDWQLEAHIEHWDETRPEIEVLHNDQVSLGLRSETPVFGGQSALAVQVESLVPLTRSQVEFWRLSWRPPEPVAHYRTLRFAFHPGTSQPVVFPVLYIFVNGRHLTTVVLSPHPSVALFSRTVLDMSVQAWHVVELPLDYPGLEAPIESISITGLLEGTFYLDDIQLLPGVRPPSTTAVQETRDSPVPEQFELTQNYPNPFNAGTVIHFSLPVAGPVELTLFNLAGQQVTTLVQGPRPAGTYMVRWDGKDAYGRELASGLYLYRLRAGQQLETRKLLLLH